VARRCRKPSFLYSKYLRTDRSRQKEMYVPLKFAQSDCLRLISESRRAWWCSTVSHHQDLISDGIVRLDRRSCRRMFSSRGSRIRPTFQLSTPYIFDGVYVHVFCVRSHCQLPTLERGGSKTQAVTWELQRVSSSASQCHFINPRVRPLQLLLLDFF
jgi:hypothetical protein